MVSESDSKSLVVIGAVSGIFGVQGWVRIYSYTSPPIRILDYKPWLVERAGGWQQYTLVAGRRHGSAIIAQLGQTRDRDAARQLIGARIAIHRQQLPAAQEGGYYWVDLLGLQVRTQDGRELGTVSRLMETGANDVLVVDNGRQRLIPFVPGQTIIDVDLRSSIITVDWDSEF